MKKKLLIAEDEKLNRMLLDKILGEEFDLLAYLDGQQAMDALQELAESIDLVLLDLNMPKKNGFEFLAEMRESAKLKRIPVIVITGYDDFQTKESALEQGAWDVIHKPLEAETIRERVNSALKKTKEKDQATGKNEKISIKNTDFSAFELLPYGVAVCDVGDCGAYYYKNEKYNAILGFSQNGVIKETPLISLVFEVYRDEVRQALIDASLACKNEINREFELLSLNRHVLWIHATFKSMTIGERQENAVLIAIFDITEEKQRKEREKIIQDQMRYRFEHDALTGLYNKTGFSIKATEYFAKRSAEAYTLLYCDICRFRMVNGLLGNDVGDRVLILLSKYLKNAEKELGGLCARFENDKFVICIPGKMTKQVADRLMATTNLAEYGIDFRVSLKYGIYENDDADMPIEQMCEKANMALAVAKADPYSHYAFYDEKLRNTIAYEIQIAEEMENAITEKQFVLFLQPVHSLSNGEPQSAEVLVRWQHPERGLITPGAFIPVFEKNGFIEKLDHYVWEETCRLLRERMDQGKREIPFSVNLSRKSIYNAGVADEIIALVDKYSIDPSLLKLEVTESAYIDNIEQMSHTVQILRAHGFTIMMDDFGSGYSSLNMLKELPVDILKIDMKFLEGFEKSTRAGSIIAAVLRMARWLSIPVIAEGVETSEQISFLHSIGCDWIQGYYFAKPMPYDQFEDYLANYRQIPSELKPAEEKTFDSNIYLGGNRVVNDILDSFDGGIALLELSGDRLELIRVSRGYYEIFGYSPDTFANFSQNVWEKMDKKEQEKEKNVFMRAADMGITQRAVITDYHADGHLMWLDCSFAFLGGTKDHGIFCVTYRDITEMKRLQVQLADAKEQIADLAESIRMYGNGAQSHPDAEALREREIQRNIYEMLLSGSDTFAFDYDVVSDVMRMFFVNEKGEHYVKKLYQYTQSIKKYTFLDEAGRETVERQLYAYLKAPQYGEVLLRVKRENRDVYRWYRAHVKSLAEHEGNVYRVFGKAEDVHEEIQPLDEDHESRIYDSLSGLLTRASAENIIQNQLRRHENTAALFLIDIDNLGAINEECGHIFGDAIIKECAQRIQHVIGENGVVARAEGDSYLAFIANIDSEEKTAELAANVLKLCACISLPADGKLSCSIGATMIASEEDSLANAYAKAEDALRCAKEAGKNQYIMQTVKKL